MLPMVHVGVHQSQYPEVVQADLLECLRSRRIRAKFHYDSIKQAAKWLALHAALSPTRKDPSCAQAYSDAFDLVASKFWNHRIELVGLGCGGGAKEAALVACLQKKGLEVVYQPVDGSLPLVLTAATEAGRHLDPRKVFPLVCDLERANDLKNCLLADAGGAARVLTLFGVLPNCEPSVILPRIASTLRPGDWVLFSTNLAPGADFREGMNSVLPQYDNPTTHDWLKTLFLDLGFDASRLEVRFRIAEGAPGLLRFVAEAHLLDDDEIAVFGNSLRFERGASIQAFFSYRYRPDILASILQAHDIQVEGTFMNATGEEGVFVCRKGSAQ